MEDHGQKQKEGPGANASINEQDGIIAPSGVALSEKPENRRKRILFFYNRSVQVKYALLSALCIFMAIFAYNYFLFYRLQIVMQGTGMSGGPEIELYRALIMHELSRNIFYGSLISIGVFGLVTGLLTMAIIHRYEGPLVSINRYLVKVAEGQPVGPLRVRERDEVSELVANINRITQKKP